MAALVKTSSVAAFSFRPALLETFRNYTRTDLIADLGAGITVGVIALPLAIGFGIASGVSPVQGLWTAIIAGFLISALGGSRFQIGGPTGAFVPVLASVVATYGYSGLAVASMMAGVILVLMGAFRLGALLRFIPYPVIAGFTSGIAVIIFIAQLNEALGLGLTMPQHVPQQLAALAEHFSTVSWYAVGVSALTLAVLYGWPRITRKVPSSIVAVVVTTVLVVWLDLPVATIGSKFGGIPLGWPAWHLPEISLERLRELMGAAATIAALGGIESLLSAAVADGMADTRHDSNQELLGQGIANLVTPLFGGIAATGAIARTAANIRSGARSPIAGIVHALVLLGIALIAAPLARFIPLATLSAILISVALRMAEWDTFVELWHGPRTDFAVLLTTFGLTVVFDLTIGVGAGLSMAVVLFIRGMEELTHVRLLTPESDIEFDGSNSLRGKNVPPGVVLYRFQGPFFFAAADKLEAALRGSGGKPKVVIFRMRHVPVMDATGLHALEVAVEKMERDKVHVLLTALQPQPMKVMHAAGLIDRIGLENVCANVDEALARSERVLTEGAAVH
jgi:SulP family sulfate permease